MTNKEFVEKLKLTEKSKTLYVLGGFGAPLGKDQRNTYANYLDYNKRKDRRNKILNSTADTFAFDCVCLIKGILWGWNADTSKYYGGAVYKSNGVPDMTIMSLFDDFSSNHSQDFTKIEIGELLVNTDFSHCGIYIGDGKAIECTYRWEDGVQITDVYNINETSNNGRFWYAHAKIDFIEYVNESNDDGNPEVILVFKQYPTSEEAVKILKDFEALGYKVRIVAEGG